MVIAERRRFPRLSLNVEVEYKILEQIEPEFVITETKNLSAGGIRIILLEKVNIGTLLELKFLIPDLNKILSAIGKVVWIEEFIVGDIKTGKAYDAGIEFINISKEDREKIKQYVISQLPLRI